MNACAECGRTNSQPNRARGLCGACYMSHVRRGDIATFPTARFWSDRAADLADDGATWVDIARWAETLEGSVWRRLHRANRHDLIDRLDANTGRPCNHKPRKRTPDWLEDVAWMAETGETWDGAAHRLNLREESVYRRLKQNDRLDLIDRINRNSGRSASREAAA